MEKYNFDTIIDRRGSGALKTDRLLERFGRPDLMAAWVADMDFATPPFVISALKKRLEHPILGYDIEPDDYRPSIIDWQRKLHNWEIEPEWISYIPGVVKGIGMAINVFTAPGDDVIIMPPVYHPFRITAQSNGRNVVNVPMLKDDFGRFHIDFDSFENLPVNKGMLILSNPHNPGGTIWHPDELRHLADICKRKNILVISDEIHADMALWGNRHTPFASVSDMAADISITFGAPSKTFNIPGIVSSYAIIPNPEIRSRFYNWLNANELGEAPTLSYIATIAAYRKGEQWRKEMLRYVEKNIVTVENFLKENLPEIIAIRPDASFLIWLDCRGLGLDHDSLVDLFVNKAKVALNDGAMFGIEGSGFMRLNVGAPTSIILEILNRIKGAAKSR